LNNVITPRLAAIIALVREGAGVIDVGSDHAYVPIYLVKEKKAVRALATDVHDGPIDRARENIRVSGLEAAIKTQKADGLCGVDVSGYDSIIIAGMGGILISEILTGAPDLKGKTLILQPMTATAELRQYLIENGYKILNECIAREEEKLYVILEAVRGESERYTEAELLLGRKTKSDPLYPLLKARTEEKLRKRLCGLEKAKEPQRDEMDRIIMILKEMRK